MISTINVNLYVLIKNKYINDYSVYWMWWLMIFNKHTFFKYNIKMSNEEINIVLKYIFKFSLTLRLLIHNIWNSVN